MDEFIDENHRKIKKKKPVEQKISDRRLPTTVILIFKECKKMISMNFKLVI